MGALHGVWLRDDIDPGTVRTGRFEVHDGQVGLVLDEDLNWEIHPDIHVTKGGQLRIVSGRTAAVPLAPGIAYSVHAPSGPSPPIVVVGSARRIETMARPEGAGRPDGLFLLADAQVTDQRGDHAVLVPWQPDVPWSVDAARLARLRDHCHPAGGDLPWTIESLQGEGLQLRLGDCRFRAPVPGDDPVLVLVAGPADLEVERLDTAWPAGHRVDSGAVLFLGVLVVLVVVAAGAGLGWWSTTWCSLALALAACLGPVLAVFAWLHLGLISVAVAAARGIYTAWRARPGVTAAAVGVLAALVTTALLLGGPGSPVDEYDQRGFTHLAEHLLVGYSTVGGAGIRDESGDLASFLQQECPAYRGVTASDARFGSTFRAHHRTLCAEAPAVSAGGRISFVGGTNDDYIWPMWRGGLISRYRLMAMFLRRVLIAEADEAGDGPSMFERLEAQSLAHLDEQRRLLGEGVHCALADGARFTYYADFLITDVPGGRSESRERLVSARRDTVLASGGEFVDLFERTEGDVGVAWFNDLIHLSEVGHRRVAQILCEDRGPIRGEPPR